jgi:hypothetical protein
MLEPSVVPALNPGYKVVMALACLALLVIAFGVWALVSERRRTRGPVLSPRVEPGDAAAPPPVADASVDALQQSLSSLERFDALQSDLRHRLARANTEMEAERGNVGSAVQLMRRAALEMRLPETVFEIYESLRLLPRKSAEAQQVDREWHRQARIEPGRVVVIDEATRECIVDFTASGRHFRVTGRSYELSRSNFDELTLFDGRDLAVLMVRVKLEPDRLRVIEATVTSYRPSPWVAVLVESRALMDERREKLLLNSRFRDVEKMRADFGMDVKLPGWGPAQ